MNIKKTLQKGYFHQLHCEDYLIIEKLTRKHSVCAVFDGCTMGTDSVFASMLYGKVLRKIVKDYYYQDFIRHNILSTATLIKILLKELFNEIKQVKNRLHLETNELLATIIITVVAEDDLCATIVAIGDGLVVVDDKVIVYDQEDKPDYIAYHLSEDFETWYASQEQEISISNASKIVLSTDGIFSFKNFKVPTQQPSETDIIHFLCTANSRTKEANS